ncbi:MAG: hypothetical protein ABR915_11205 [Thermoguttaceae bacterium]
MEITLNLGVSILGSVIAGIIIVVVTPRVRRIWEKYKVNQDEARNLLNAAAQRIVGNPLVIVYVTTDSIHKRLKQFACNSLAVFFGMMVLFFRLCAIEFSTVTLPVITYSFDALALGALYFCLRNYWKALNFRSEAALFDDIIARAEKLTRETAKQPAPQPAPAAQVATESPSRPQ